MLPHATLLLTRRLARQGVRRVFCLGHLDNAGWGSAFPRRLNSAGEGHRSSGPGFSFKHIAVVLAALGIGCTSKAHAEGHTSESSVPVPQDTLTRTSTPDVRLCKQAFQLLSPERRRRTFFTYEKRIRELSPPDKTFDYFASVKKDETEGPAGSRFMHPEDLMHALIATYPRSEGPVRAGALAGEKAALRPPAAASPFFAQFDTDGDGLISYEEFLLVMSFLAILPQDVGTVFAVLDENANSMISKEEFAAVTAVLRRRLRRVSHVQRTGLDTSSGGEATGGLMMTFFGADGRHELDLRHFDDFIEALHVELVRLEYCHYDPDNRGWVSGRAFAHSLVASVPVATVDRYLARVDQLPHALAGCKVSHQSFDAWATLRRRGGHKLAVALEMLNMVRSDGVRRADLQRAARLASGQALADEQVDIVFELFGDKDGSLDCKAFMRALQAREGSAQYARNLASRGREDTPSVFMCLRHCFMPD